MSDGRNYDINQSSKLAILRGTTSISKCLTFPRLSNLFFVGEMVTALPDDEVKEILYHAMPN